MKIECYIYTRADKKKSALETKKPTKKFIVNLKTNKIRKIYERPEN